MNSPSSAWLQSLKGWDLSGAAHSDGVTLINWVCEGEVEGEGE